MTSRIHVTVISLKPFWKATRDLIPILFQPKRLPICPEHLHAFAQRFAGVKAICLISEMSVSVMFLSLASLMRPVILDVVTLNPRIHISPSMFL